MSLERRRPRRRFEKERRASRAGRQFDVGGRAARRYTEARGSCVAVRGSRTGRRNGARTESPRHTGDQL